MSITLTFTADTIEAAYDQMWEALRGHRHVAPVPKPQGSPPDADRPRRAHRRVRSLETPVAAPVATPRPVQGVVAVEEEGPAPEEDFVVVSVPGLDPEPDYPSFVEDRTEPEYVEVPVPSGNATAEALANEKLKQEIVASLASRFAAGQVKSIRAVLTKYGGGAKSYPEIDASKFPEIAAALERGEAA